MNMEQLTIVQRKHKIRELGINYGDNDGAVQQ
jgi:hypothetical protein